MFPAMAPASMREASSHQMFLAQPSITYDRHAPARLLMSTGRRP